MYSKQYRTHRKEFIANRKEEKIQAYEKMEEIKALLKELKRFENFQRSEEIVNKLEETLDEVLFINGIEMITVENPQELYNFIINS